MKKVFISSTSKDLKKYRKAVYKSIKQLEEYPIDMKYFTPNGATPVQMCYDKVSECKIFIGIYAHRYGWQPGLELQDEKKIYKKVDGTKGECNDHRSITYYEYLWAKELGIPCLCFIVKPDYPWNPEFIESPHIIDDPRFINDPQYKDDPPKKVYYHLDKFKEEIKGIVIDEFTTKDNLASLVSTSLSKLLRKMDKAEKASQVSHEPPRCPPQPRKPSKFGGRRALREQLKRDLCGVEKFTALTALHAFGGIGKTTLAQMLAYELYGQTFEAVIWQDIHQKPQLDNILRTWIESYTPWKLEQQLERDTLINLARLAVIHLIEEECECKPSQLLVVLDDVWQDGVEVIDTLKSICPDETTLLMTTRYEHIAITLNATPKQISIIEDNDIPEFFIEYLSDDVKSHQDTLITLGKTLGGHALAMRIAARYLHTVMGRPEKYPLGARLLRKLSLTISEDMKREQYWMN